jgi:photosystem II stability/assembly factor-like uncharacterized protein
VEAVGGRIFITGNLHTPMATLDSILLASEDSGSTWTEPHPRIHSAGLDQIQFVDSQNGWISGANLQGAPRDPFFLITTDGGKTWREQPIFEETRVAAVEHFWFDSPEHGVALIDEPGSAESTRFPKEKPAGWRVRTDTATHSYVIEKSENNRGQKIASFLVSIASCKE